MVYVFTIGTGIVRFLVWELGDRLGKAVHRLCGDRMEIVRCWCSCHAVSADSTQKLYNAHAGSVQRPFGDGVVIVEAVQ